MLCKAKTGKDCASFQYCLVPLVLAKSNELLQKRGDGGREFWIEVVWLFVLDRWCVLQSIDVYEKNVVLFVLRVRGVLSTFNLGFHTVLIQNQ